MTRFTILAILALLMLTACPSGSGGSSSSSSSSSGGEANTSTATTPPPEPPVIVPAGTLDWQGWQLGASWEDSKARLGDARLIELWAEPAKLGQVTAYTAALSEFPEHVLVFLDSQLVGYNLSDMMPVEQFANFRAELTGKLGEPTTEPPQWALNSPYFEGYKPPIKELTCYYWSDEPARAVLQLMFNSITGLGVVALANVDYFTKANERIAASDTAAAPADTPASEEPAEPAMGADEGAITVTTACDYTLDGFRLGDIYSFVKTAFPNDGSLIISDMWAVEPVTGMTSSNPSDLSQPYPAIAAWFLDGALAGYIRTEGMTRDEFIAATDVFDTDYGAALFEPPAWYLASPDGKNYVEPDQDTEQLIWADKKTEAILFAQYNYADSLATFMLFDTVAFPAAQNQTMASLGYGEPGEQ